MRGKTANSGNEGVTRDDYVGVTSVSDATGPAVPKWSPGAKKVNPPSFLVKGEPARVKSGSSTTHYRRGGMVRRAAGGWIKGAVGANPGGLHKSLGVPEGEKIPAGKIEKAAHSSNPKVKKQAVLAETLSHLRK